MDFNRDSNAREEVLDDQIRLVFPTRERLAASTLRTGGANSFDLSLTKAVPFRDLPGGELRRETLNAFNHLQYINVPPMNVHNTPPGQFLKHDFTGSDTRSMCVQVKFVV
jgi:hypothetical protein